MIKVDIYLMSKYILFFPNFPFSISFIPCVIVVSIASIPILLILAQRQPLRLKTKVFLIEFLSLVPKFVTPRKPQPELWPKHVKIRLWIPGFPNVIKNYQHKLYS